MDCMKTICILSKAIVTSLVDFNRRRRLKKMAKQFGTFEDILTQEELRLMREERRQPRMS